MTVEMTADDLSLIREWVQASTADATISAAWDLHKGDINKVVLGLLNSELTALIEQPESVSIDGALSISRAGNITAMRERIRQFRDQGGVTGGSVASGVGKLHRPNPR